MTRTIPQPLQLPEECQPVVNAREIKEVLIFELKIFFFNDLFYNYLGLRFFFFFF
jgi:hypothetical protein